MYSLELNHAYYHECVAKALEQHCPTIFQRHAAALIGWGSEVLGNDDELSKRYGWGPRLALFLTQDDHRTWAETLVQILQTHIPPTFRDLPTRYTADGPPYPTTNPNAPVGIAITTCERFIELYLGLAKIAAPTPPLPAQEWLLINEAGLLRLTAGTVYCDRIGRLTELRQYFAYFPEDVWRYKLAYQWESLSWDIDLVGVCAHRGDTLSARIAAARSVERIVGLVFLLNKVYRPGYLKWFHRQFYKLPYLVQEIGPQLEAVMTMTDCAQVTERMYPILDRLIEFQCTCAKIPLPDYKKPPLLDPGFFTYDLWPLITALRHSIHGELAQLPTTIGALDQWITDQDLLLAAQQLRLLGDVYARQDPKKVLFERTRLEDQGV